MAPGAYTTWILLSGCTDTTTPIEVEATGKFYTDLRDTPYQWTAEQKYANGVRLITWTC
jgi:hypothetical protein